MVAPGGFSKAGPTSIPPAAPTCRMFVWWTATCQGLPARTTNDVRRARATRGGAVQLDDLRTERRVVVRSTPVALYDMVADVPNIGHWSPVCRACWWDDGAGPAVGSWFTGRNERDGRV